MESAEYDNLAAVEAEHWYYAGKRTIVRSWLRRTGVLQPDALLLDCGAGTGAFADEMQDHCQVVVLDDHEESIERLRQRFSAEQVIGLSGDSIPLGAGSVDMVTALDVLEHVPDDRAVVREFARVVRSGGAVVVTVPAFMLLWSEWDEVLHHFRRYRLAQLRALFPAEDWVIEHTNYTNTLAFPAVLLLRRGRSLLRKIGLGKSVRSEDRVPPAWINRFARWAFVTPAVRGLWAPFGVSAILVARRR
ncbi:class I SAM-dependent methyltransferase [Actomonas aquatica]|uniref:Class I SAM-dependent methyltransferase n=1 Tax=Actomonas aquatica TaxID=2866162 RepID=A0ABZ1CH04_9BACT|nr:class I SAM-dependent methyltransferase [Opitutus sp. WL0086]WRQ89550.1 class I SAM-dependent methyltransferase [Opitutus sp. WL0086]